VWKKAGKLTLKLAEVPVERLEAAVAHKLMFEATLASVAHEKEQNVKLEAKFNHMADERKEILISMDQMTKFKNSLETDLYSSFLPILHSKQEKVREYDWDP
jgi:hypothetical protein